MVNKMKKVDLKCFDIDLATGEGLVKYNGKVITELPEYKEYLSGVVLNKIDSSKAAQAALEYQGAGWVQFVDQPFSGSAEVRDQVGTCFVNVVVNKKDINQAIIDTLNTLGPAYQKK